MNAKRRTSWQSGSVFAVPLPDGSFAIGQAIAMMMPNVVYCALTNQRLLARPLSVPALAATEVVSRVALTREQLDFGAWVILGSADLIASKADFANEQCADRGYVGAKVFDAGLAQDFLAAFHALAAWDDWHDPNYLDGWLVSPTSKPTNLRFKSGGAARY